MSKETEKQKKTCADTVDTDLSEFEEGEIIDVDLSEDLARWGFYFVVTKSEDIDPVS